MGNRILVGKSPSGNLWERNRGQTRKEAARSTDGEPAFKRIPISTLHYELEEAKQQWKKEWGKIHKGSNN